MTQEQKQILLVDLCARLPYRVQINHQGYIQELTVIVLEDIIYSEHEVKPYLRPMSSMTEEEKVELYTRAYAPDEMKTLDEKLYVIQTNAKNAADFYNEHHFDYRGLIPMGLALEAPEGMYK